METHIIKARVCQRLIDKMHPDKLLQETVEDCGGNKVHAARIILEISNDMAIEPRVRPTDYAPYYSTDTGLRSCNYCVSREGCPARREAETDLMLEMDFINRAQLLTSTKFWQAIAENCELYVLQKEGPK